MCVCARARMCVYVYTCVCASREEGGRGGGGGACMRACAQVSECAACPRLPSSTPPPAVHLPACVCYQ